METAEEGVAREVAEETGLKVTSAKYLFSLPNIYIYSGFEEHTLDLFFLCEVEDDTLPIANDDVEQLLWIKLEDIDESLFGLQSIRKGVRKFIKEYAKR